MLPIWAWYSIAASFVVIAFSTLVIFIVIGDHENEGTSVTEVPQKKKTVVQKPAKTEASKVTTNEATADTHAPVESISGSNEVRKTEPINWVYPGGALAALATGTFINYWDNMDISNMDLSNMTEEEREWFKGAEQREKKRLVKAKISSQGQGLRKVDSEKYLKDRRIEERKYNNNIFHWNDEHFDDNERLEKIVKEINEFDEILKNEERCANLDLGYKKITPEDSELKMPDFSNGLVRSEFPDYCQAVIGNVPFEISNT